jgi:hypothetical protein
LGPKTETGTQSEEITFEELLTSIKQRFYLWIGNFLIFYVSLSIFPVLVFQLGFYYEGIQILSPLSFAFSFGDVIGRILANYYVVEQKPRIICYYSSRFLYFVVYIALLNCEMSQTVKSVTNLLLTFSLGVTNGHGVTSIFAKNGGDPDKALSKSTTFGLNFMMFFGLACGSLMSVFY